MSFSSLGERLALVIDADATGAISALRKVGSESEAQFTKARTSQEKWSKGLLTGGAAAIGVAAVVGKGLLSTVHAYAGWEEAQLKVENTMRNQPQLAGASEKAFESLANRISNTTKVDRDAALSSAAMLGQFGLTQKQIETLIPLVVDYSVKTGTDMVSATKAVGKAVDGSAGGLAKQGIILDKTAYAADHYGTVVDALSSKVGGFAEEQGKTFEGRLDIIRNQLHDLAEGVGKGATEELGQMLGGVEHLTTGFGHLSTGTQDMIGRVATVGVTTIGAAGALAVGAGAALKLKDAMFAANAETGALELTTAGSIGAYGALAVGVLALGATLKDTFWGATDGAFNAAKADAAFADSLLGAVKNAYQAQQAVGNLTQAVADWAGGQNWAEQEQSGVAIIRNLGLSYVDVAKAIKGSQSDLMGWIEGLHLSSTNAGILTGGLEGLRSKLQTSAQNTLFMLVATGQLNPKLADTAIKMTRLSEGTPNYVAALTLATSGSKALAVASGDVSAALKIQRDEQERLAEKALDVRDATRNLESAELSIANTAADVTAKEQALADARAHHAEGSAEVQQAERDLAAAMIASSQAGDDARRSVEDLVAKELNASGPADALATKHDAFVTALGHVRDSLAPGSVLRKELDNYIAQLGGIPAVKQTVISTKYVNTGGGSGPVKHFAAGGDPPVGEAVDVGEHGDEIAVFDSPVHIYPHGEGPSSAPGTGAAAVVTNHFTINVNTGLGSNVHPAQIGTAVVDAMSAWCRANGPLPRTIRMRQ